MLKLKKYPKQSSYWYIRGTVNGKYIYESTRTTDLAEAEALLALRSAAMYRDQVLQQNATTLPSLSPDMIAHLGALGQYARNRSAKKYQAKGITTDFVCTLFVNQRGRCALSGVQFRLDPLGGKSKRHAAFAPSLDRIDNEEGYTENNVRLVCRIVNYALNIWGDHALVEMALGVTDTWEKTQRAILSNKKTINFPSAQEA